MGQRVPRLRDIPGGPSKGRLEVQTSCPNGELIGGFLGTHGRAPQPVGGVDGTAMLVVVGTSFLSLTT